MQFLPDSIKLPGFNSGERASERMQLEAHAQFNAQIAAQLGAAAQAQTDTIAALRSLLEQLNRPRTNVFPTVRRFVVTDTSPTNFQQFELPQGQNWELESVTAFARNPATNAGLAVGVRLDGLTVGEEPVFIQSIGSEAERYVRIGLPVYPGQQIRLAQITANGETILYFRFAPIGA